MFDDKSIKILSTTNKINKLAIWIVIGSALFYSASKYPVRDTFKNIYTHIPGWIEQDDDVGRDIVSIE